MCSVAVHADCPCFCCNDAGGWSDWAGVLFHSDRVIGTLENGPELVLRRRLPVLVGESRRPEESLDLDRCVLA